jgi:DNA polymerase III delta prime subunit
MIDLWTEKYRPKDVSGYVFTDVATKEQVEAWIKEGTVPHLLLHGPAGTGKTTLAKILVNQLHIDEYDCLQVNASRDNGVDYLKTRIEGFVSTMPFGPFKIVILDEADYLSPNAQGLLRGLMETYQAQARFILTCNLLHKIITPLKSRCYEIHVNKSDQVEFYVRASTVLASENVAYEDETLASYVAATYPDLRKCLQLLQGNSKEGQLLNPRDSISSTQDYKLVMVDLIKQRKFKEARQLLCKQARPEEMEEIFRWLYDNLDLWSSTDEGQDEAILVIGKYMSAHSLVADPEINLAACMVELSRVKQ